MQTGSVVWFNEKNGYGFIKSDGKDYFVHFKEINQEGFKTLKGGEKVSFEAATSPKGGVAKNVTLI